MDYSIFIELGLVLGVMLVGAWVFKPTAAERRFLAETRRKEFKDSIRIRDEDLRHRFPREPRVIL